MLSLGIHYHEDAAIVFTNLALSQIDGSVVFIANALRVFSVIFNRVFLVTIHQPGENFLGRCSDIDNIEVSVCAIENSRETLGKIAQENNISLILARVWGDNVDWLDSAFEDKVVLYWTLLETYSQTQINLFNRVGGLAFQTKQLKYKVENTLSKKNSILFPPLVSIPGTREISPTESILPICISYIGTLRPECYGIEMLRCFRQIIQKYSYINLTIAIGKIHFKDPTEKNEVRLLIDQLSESERVSIKIASSHQECQSIMAQSDIGLSLWEPNDQNINQISTKFLEYLSNNCITICFRSPIYEDHLGSDYSFFITNINELENALEKSILSAFNTRGSCANTTYFRNALTHYSIESHVSRISRYIGHFNQRTRKYLASSFSNDFDCIYGLYIDEGEKNSLLSLGKRLSIPITLFKGVNGALELESDYEAYSRLPLATEWELGAKKKRLTIGAMGHLKSFINIAKDALDKGFRKIFIIESDVVPHQSLLELYFSNRILDYKVLYLGAGMWRSDVEMRDGYYVPNGTTGTFAIALDSSILPELIERWSQMIDPTDIVLTDVCDKYRDECFVCFPNLLICDVSNSSTTSPRSQKDLSKKFQWHLDDYDIHFVETVGFFVENVEIVVNHVVNDPCITIIDAEGCLQEMVVHGSATLLVGCQVDRIEYRNLFITDFIYL